jgi:hypothetical protein
MAAKRPSRIRWTEHAGAKADLLRVSRADVEDAVLEHHDRRTENTGAADWRVAVGRLVVAYDYPHDDDELTARVVTLWRA